MHGATQKDQRARQAFENRPWAPHTYCPSRGGGGGLGPAADPAALPAPQGGRAPRRSPPPPRTPFFSPFLSGFLPSQDFSTRPPTPDFSTPDNKGGGRAASALTQRRARPRPAPPLPSGEAGPAPRVWRGRAGGQSVSESVSERAAAGLPPSLLPPGASGSPCPRPPRCRAGRAAPAR